MTRVDLLLGGGLALTAIGCVLPAFSAGEGEGGGASTVSASSVSSGAAPGTSASTGSAAPASGGGAGDGGASATGGGGAGCGDTQTDPLHCGACGVSCLGGDCVDGECQPVLLAYDPALVYGHVAVGGGRVWWKGVDVVSWLPTSVTETTIPESVTLEYADMIAADASGAYVTTLQQSRRVVHITMDGEILDLADQEKPLGIVVEDGILYWTQYLATPAPVWTRPALEGTPEPIPLDLVWGVQVAVDGGDVYATYHGEGDLGGGVARIKPGGAREDVATGQSKPSAIALSPSYVFWLDYGGAVWRRQRNLKAGPALVAAAIPGAEVFNGEMATDGAHVYWTAPSVPPAPAEPPPDCTVCGAVRRVGLGGGEPQVFADVSDGINGLAVDDLAVYWTTSVPPGLWRKAKQPPP